MTSKRKNPCTNWFPGRVKPVRGGAYKRLYNGFVMFCWFDKKTGHFGSGHFSPDYAKEAFRSLWASDYQNLAWCGLANEPEKSK